MKNWKVARFGHASKGRDNSRINNGLRDSLSRNRITVSLKFHQEGKNNLIIENYAGNSQDNYSSK